MSEKGARLRARLAAGAFVLAPGVFEMLSARIADRLGFNALYLTGYGVSASHLGVPDAGLLSYRDMLERARTVAEAVAAPLIADADTGFGGLINVRHTVRGYEAAGVAAIQIEDQEMPKKCGHTPGRRVVAFAEAVRRIEVAVEARRSKDFLVIARTDARATHGLEEAIRRARAFARAGADVLFVEAPESEEEFARIGDGLAGEAWLLANMIPGGKSPVLPAERLRKWGYALAIYPTAGLAAACAALEASYRHLAARGTMDASTVPAWEFRQLNELVGFPEVWEFERRFAEQG